MNNEFKYNLINIISFENTKSTRGKIKYFK